MEIIPSSEKKVGKTFSEEKKLWPSYNNRKIKQTTKIIFSGDGCHQQFFHQIIN